MTLASLKRRRTLLEGTSLPLSSARYLGVRAEERDGLPVTNTRVGRADRDGEGLLAGGVLLMWGSSGARGVGCFGRLSAISPYVVSCCLLRQLELARSV